MKKSTVLLVLLFLGIITGFVYKQQEIIDRLYRLMGNSKIEETRETLAAITELTRNVKLKKTSATVWDMVEKGMRLALLDTLSTSLASDAVITFDSGYNFKLNENSLIVIENPDDKQKKKMIVLSLNNGIIQGKNVIADETTVKIKTGNITTEVKGKASFGVRMREEDNVAEVWVNEGRAEVTDKKGQKDEVNVNEHKQYPADQLQQDQKIIFIKAKEEVKEDKNINFVSTGSSEGKEGLSRGVINQIISRQRKKINNCYDKSQLSGKGNKVAVRLVIEGNGTVSSVSIPSSTIGDPGIEECIRFWIKAIKFPQFKGSALSESVQFVFE